eukprot:CAMPEP_0197862478 /NCGR_PEP_ID=MMETSP1438-20131217/39280_1 /TAXON_ID=1461541 /ORGANISM="Pterosperma sp., Strain CCMP1384" /LENGTH=109 /DNA_ID=CAMNT_0043480055 /DNA_START=67 /DNA_END=393 /DNA_ORIENTATION=+
MAAATTIMVKPPGQEAMSEAGPVTEGFSMKTTTDIPEALQVKILCAKCGIVSCDPTGDDWCVNRCFCVESSVGLKDCTEQQLLCIKLGPSGLKTTTQIPDAIRCDCLLW